MATSGARELAARAMKAAAGRLGEPRGPALLRTAAAARDLMTGASPPVRAPAPSRPPLTAGGPLPDVWPEPPDVARSGRTGHSLLTMDGEPTRYDLDLFLALNEEYRDRPVVPAPPRYDRTSLRDQARRRLTNIHAQVDLAGKRTLEIGCGNGFEVWSLAHVFGCDAHGVDVADHHTWPALAGERVHFTLADIAHEHPFAPGSFDRILSFTVWEHVEHPRRALEETYRMLAPGGIAWIRANLWMGPLASHRYRDVFFPWPHLLFSDEVFRDFYVHIGREPMGAAWVNRLSWLHYEEIFRDVGFDVRNVLFTTTPIDEPFYARFVDVLGRYPRVDLTRDFFRVVLQRPLDS